MKAEVKGDVDLDKLGDDILDRLQDLIEEYQTKTVVDMKNGAPVKTGKLVGLINGQISGDGFISTINSDAEYSAFHEFGTYASVDRTYINEMDVDQYASGFKGLAGNTSRGGIIAKKFFFANARKNYIALINKFNKG